MIDLSLLPKAELHLHIEGTFEPELIVAMAQRNGVKLEYPNVQALHDAYKFTGLQSFLNLYYAGMSALQTEQDYEELAAAYLQKAHRQNVRHAEIFFDPQAHTSRGIAFKTVVEGLWRALQKAEAECGITSKLIMCFLRDQSAKSAMDTLEEALPYRDRIVAVGLDSAEVGNPPSKFKTVFDRARAEG
ncbi:MAG: adenosine deaminase, partial [Candidatus Eremiobacteraeota bacterium]|nr:adenosine deaminase [Candidatus Eremiobacteraeota bacterium]